MSEGQITFTHTVVKLSFDKSLADLLLQHSKEDTVFMVDENVYNLYKIHFSDQSCIIVPSGEQYKIQATADAIIEQLLDLNIGKSTLIIGIGGGVTTDITGYIASTYKRGLEFILMPTSILAMVDAAIGGKNGVNTTRFKNIVGTIYQPREIIFDYAFLQTLPKEEFVNGFAEIIKHACIKDAALFKQLQEQDINYYINNQPAIAQLIEKNVAIKAAVVTGDETEKGDRMLLNFGHTIGHAIEKISTLKHGFAISIGMVIAARISEEINGFYSDELKELKDLLVKYGLPVHNSFTADQLWEVLLGDKKRNRDVMPFIVLNKIGEGKIIQLPLEQLKDLLKQVLCN